jgi:transketolase
MRNRTFLPFEKKKYLIDKARVLRKHVIEMIWNAQSGHPGGSLSLADIMTVIYFYMIKYNSKDPEAPDRDRVILSKGHGAPIWYAALAEAGFFSLEELGRLRKIDALLEGHPCIHIPGVDLTTGSLGLGLSGGCGMAIAARLRKMDKIRIHVILGDGELQEGQVWEAVMAAAHFKLDNLVAVVDRNHYQNDGATEDIMGLEPLSAKWEAFGWATIEIDGHDMDQIARAFESARQKKEKPTVIIANTVKGKGASYLIDQPSLHYTAPTTEQKNQALKELGFMDEEKGAY